jgi:hypothetical protein
VRKDGFFTSPEDSSWNGVAEELGARQKRRAAARRLPRRRKEARAEGEGRGQQGRGGGGDSVWVGGCYSLNFQSGCLSCPLFVSFPLFYCFAFFVSPSFSKIMKSHRLYQTLISSRQVMLVNLPSSIDFLFGTQKFTMLI